MRANIFYFPEKEGKVDAMDEIEQKLISGEIVPPTTEEELASYLAEVNA